MNLFPFQLVDVVELLERNFFIASQLVLGAQMGLFAALRGTPGLLEAFGFVGKGKGGTKEILGRRSWKGQDADGLHR